MISIITAAYNCEKYISQAIESVLAQTFNDWEMIIVDDISTDKTAEIAEVYTQKDARIKLIKPEKKLYSAGARNLATDLAQGRFITFLDADDCWSPLKLNIQHDFMLSNDCALSFTSYQVIDNQGLIHPYIIEALPKVTSKDLQFFNPIGCLTVMYDQIKTGKLKFPTGYIFQEDYVLWVNTLRNLPYIFYGITAPLAFYRLHPTNRSGNKWQVALYHWKVVYKRCFHWNFFQKIYFFSFYMLTNLRKYYKLRTPSL
jgi:teichuronic acid biosynthesis glycosyltransferase TuaG